jgi:hypothetical protein
VLKTMLWVGLFAVCICWAIGAYNRMVRLRAAALAKDAGVSTSEQYNQAIKQFPASLLAALFAFKPVIQGDNKAA